MRLPSSRSYRFLLAGSITSQLGDWAARLSLAVLVFERTGDKRAVGLVAALLVIPWLGLGQWLSVWGDRLDRRQLLMACDSARAVIFVAIGALDLPLPGILGLVFVAATIDPVFESNRSALIADVVSKADYAAATQVSHTVSQTAQLVGFGMGGILAGWLGAGGALVLNGVTFLGSAALVSRVKVATHGVRKKAKPTLRAAARFLAADRVSRIAVIGTLVAVSTAMSVESQAVAFGSEVTGFGPRGVGLLAAAVPVGTIAMLWLLDAEGDDLTLLRRGFRLAIVAAWCSIPLLLWGRVPAAAIAGYVTAGGVFIFSTAGNMVVGRRIPDDIRAGTFAVLQAAVFLAVSAGNIVGGLVAEWWRSEYAAASAMGLATAGLLATRLWLARTPISEPAAEPEEPIPAR